MEYVLLFLATDVLLTTTVTTVQRRTRESIVLRWQEGSLSYEELKVLKQLSWFQNIWNPTKEKVPREKKQN